MPKRLRRHSPGPRCGEIELHNTAERDGARAALRDRRARGRSHDALYAEQTPTGARDLLGAVFGGKKEDFRWSNATSAAASA